MHVECRAIVSREGRERVRKRGNLLQGGILQWDAQHDSVLNFEHSGAACPHL